MTGWKPTSDSSVATRRAEILERARQFFRERDVLAVDTPALGRHAMWDPSVESLSVRTKSGQVSFLQTSPEIYMKRLLAAGYPDIYTVCRVFRDGETGKRHQSEFTLAEWYRLGFGLDSIIDDTLQFIASCLNISSLADNAARYDYAEAFRESAAFDIFAASTDELKNRATNDARLRDEIGEDRDAALDLIMSTIVAPQFEHDRLTVVRHYPASQASLARLCPDDDRVAERFEIFCGDVELANGYVELTDPGEQQQRIERDLKTRQQSGQSSFAGDEALIAALHAGLPDCAGVAVGIERLQMVLDQTDDIQDVVTFVTGT